MDSDSSADGNKRSSAAQREGKRKRDLTAEAAAVGADFFQAALPCTVYRLAIKGALCCCAVGRVRDMG